MRTAILDDYQNVPQKEVPVPRAGERSSGGTGGELSVDSSDENKDLDHG
jgi:hypothetical protein